MAIINVGERYRYQGIAGVITEVRFPQRTDGSNYVEFKLDGGPSRTRVQILNFVEDAERIPFRSPPNDEPAPSFSDCSCEHRSHDFNACRYSALAGGHCDSCIDRGHFNDV